jgi:hypothetical protein
MRDLWIVVGHAIAGAAYRPTNRSVTFQQILQMIARSTQHLLAGLTAAAIAVGSTTVLAWHAIDRGIKLHPWITVAVTMAIVWSVATVYAIGIVSKVDEIRRPVDYDKVWAEIQRNRCGQFVTSTSNCGREPAFAEHRQ